MHGAQDTAVSQDDGALMRLARFAVLGAIWAAVEAPLPPHSWATVPTYAFCAPADRAMNATELSWLQGR